MKEVVVADASPIRYLVLIKQINLLAILFEQILVPEVVVWELTRLAAPAEVRDWISRCPGWVQVVANPDTSEEPDPLLQALDAGERSAIRIALEHGAARILVDERRASAVAARMGLKTSGTLGMLALAASEGLIEMRVELEKLKRTNFRYSQKLLDALGERFPARG